MWINNGGKQSCVRTEDIDWITFPLSISKVCITPTTSYSRHLPTRTTNEIRPPLIRKSHADPFSPIPHVIISHSHNCTLWISPRSHHYPSRVFPTTLLLAPENPAAFEIQFPAFKYSRLLWFSHLLWSLTNIWPVSCDNRCETETIDFTIFA